MTATTLDRKTVARLYGEEGLTIRQIAARLGVSHTSVHRALIAAKVARRPRGSTAPLLPAARRDKILELYRSGMPIQEIMSTLRTSSETVKKVAAAAGEPPRRRGAQQLLDWEQIAGLREQGWPPAAIAVLVGASEGHVRAVLREFGYGRQVAELPGGPELVELYGRLRTVQAVASHLGACPRRVKRALAAAGVDVTRKRRAGAG